MFTLEQARDRMRRTMQMADTTEAGAGPANAAATIAALEALDGDTAPAADPAPVTPDPTPSDDDDEDPTDNEASEGADELGDKGKQALDRMKEKLKTERARRQAAEAKLHDALPPDDAQRLAAEAEAKALEKANTRILSAEVRAAATGKLSDPSDALTFIDLTQFEVDDDGEVDREEIATAITDLLTKKPYLAAQGGPKTPKPDPSQGAVGGAPATAAQRFAAQFKDF
jgi:hypothetical protein